MNTTKIIYLFLFDTLSDWEIGYVTAGINSPMIQINQQQYQLKTFSIDGKPIRTIGGLQITPDLSLSDVVLSCAEMLILPGGQSWDAGGNQEVLLLAKKFHENKIKVAAICGATLGLAKSGLLDSVKHTSNSKEYLLGSHYQGGEYYVNELSVSHAGIITASGTAPLEFAKDIFQALHLYKTEVLEAWYKLFKTGSPAAFAELMAALGVS
jgi:putative intracellular protease/amidase